MSEFKIHTPSEVSATMSKIGYPETVKATEVFPNYHPDRIVFRAQGLTSGKDMVVKVRKNDLDGELEVEKVRALVSSYRFSGGHFDAVDVKRSGDILAIEMPYLGRSLSAIAQDMDIRAYNDDTTEAFRGFSQREIEALLKTLEASQVHFADMSGLIHGDLIQPHYAPSNIVYNSGIRRLLLVDGEAMALATDEARARFIEQLGDVKEWMYLNLESEAK